MALSFTRLNHSGVSGMLDINVHVRVCDQDHGGVRIVPALGRIVEQSGPVATTPQRRGRPCGELLMSFKMSDSQQVPLSIQFKDKKGNPAAQPPGAVAWLTDNTDLLALTPSADGLSCLVLAVGPLGTGTVTVKVVAPDESTAAAGSIEVEIDAGNATAIEVSPGAVAEQP